MRVFEKGNWIEEAEPCPVCNSKKDGQVVLIPMDDKVEGFNAEARQVHLDCIDLWFNSEMNFFYQRLK